MEMDTASETTGEMADEENELIAGSLEPPVVLDSNGLKKWLGFLLYALGERFRDG